MTHEQSPALEAIDEQAETGDVVEDILAARAALNRQEAPQVAAHLLLERTLVEQGILNPVNTYEEVAS